MVKTDLQLIAQSYDRTIDYGRNGIDLYKDLPESITDEPAYSKWKEELERGSEGSGGAAVKAYLSPDAKKKFIDLGCSLNLMFHGYGQWPSLYHGVDISEQTIQLLYEYTATQELPVGSLYCGGIHETPFEDDCFDIGACIGVLEYFEADYVRKALWEIHRIMRPGGKFVLDIPNISSSSGKIMMMIETYMGRPVRFEMQSHDFEDMLGPYFEIVENGRDDRESMSFMYYLSCKK